MDRINILRKRVQSREEFLIQAGEDRLRPILMTTSSTVFGFVPMAFSWGQSSDLWSPLAITIVGGLLSSTVLTLFIIPTIYMLFEDLGAMPRKIQAKTRVLVEYLQTLLRRKGTSE